MDKTTVEQMFEENASELETSKAQLARYGTYLLILLGFAAALLGIAVLELMMADATNSRLPFMLVWLIPQFGSLAIAIHLTVSAPWRRYPMDLRRPTIINALSVAWVAFFAVTIRYLNGTGAVCVVPGFFIAAVWGVALYYWRYTRFPRPKPEEMFP